MPKLRSVIACQLINMVTLAADVAGRDEFMIVKAAQSNFSSVGPAYIWDD